MPHGIEEAHLSSRAWTRGADRVGARRKRSSSHFPLPVRWKVSIRTAEVKPFPRYQMFIRCGNGLQIVRRFTHPRELMSYLGLTPSEHTSMDRVRRGSITKTGNTHVGRILVETAKHYRYRPSVFREMKKRREGQPLLVLAIADRAQRRLHRLYFKLKETHRKVVTVAITRELIGFIWAILWHQALPVIAA